MAVESGYTAECANITCHLDILKRKKRGFAVNVVDDWFHSSLNGELPEVLLDKSSLMFGLLKPNRCESF